MNVHLFDLSFSMYVYLCFIKDSTKNWLVATPKMKLICLLKIESKLRIDMNLEEPELEIRLVIH